VSNLHPRQYRTSGRRCLAVSHICESENAINDALKRGACLTLLLRTFNDRGNDSRSLDGVPALRNRKFRLAVFEHFFKQGLADFILERAFKVALEAAMMCFSMLRPILLRFPNDAQ